MEESQGPIFDCTHEHLGTADAAIIKIRRCFLDLLEADQDAAAPPGLDPAS